VEKSYRTVQCGTTKHAHTNTHTDTHTHTQEVGRLTNFINE